MYADDSTMYYAANTHNELNQVLSQELETVHDWITSNKLVLNISKTKGIIFGSRHRLSARPKLDLYVDKVPIEQVEKVQLLGMVIDNHLTWSKQIDNVIRKMGVGIHMTRRCEPYVPSHILEQVCRPLILSHLDYCSVVWASATKTVLFKLQVAQNRAARLVLGYSSRTSVRKMQSSLSWLSVENRLASSTVTFLGNTLRTHRPEFLKEQIVLCNTVHKHNTRKASNGDIVQAHPKTNFRKRTVLYRASKIWNELPQDIRQEKSKISFKRRIKVHFS